jgi:hypothetical protein
LETRVERTRERKGWVVSQKVRRKFFGGKDGLIKVSLKDIQLMKQRTAMANYSRMQ